MPLSDFERAVVVGLGVSGEAAAEVLLEEGIQVRVTDHQHSPAVAERATRLIEKGAEVMLGGHDPALVNWADLIVVSPGVPPSNPILETSIRKGVKIWSEIELAWRITDAPIIAITGTNGKTTTTELVTEILNATDTIAVAAGNIGRPLVKAARSATEGSVIVCEASSFQLAFIEGFRPKIAVVLNVADDHYDWHSTYENYLSAKARITENQSTDDVLIVKSSDSGCISIARGSRAQLRTFDPSPIDSVFKEARSAIGRVPGGVAGVQEGRVFVEIGGERTPMTRLENIRLFGLHNLDNILGASLCAVERGVDAYAAGKAIENFEGLPHRTSWVGEIDGVTYIDDSKATNPHATLRALDGLDRVVLIAGGRSKSLDLSVLAGAKGRLVGAVVMGESASELEVIFAGIRVRRAADVEEAVEVARGMASSGDTVLLSPACSSLDQYSSYAERGERFVKAVLG